MERICGLGYGLIWMIDVLCRFRLKLDVGFNDKILFFFMNINLFNI